MPKVKYIMVTHFDNHWDNLPNNETSYSIGMLRKGLNLPKIKEFIFR